MRHSSARSDSKPPETPRPTAAEPRGLARLAPSGSWPARALYILLRPLHFVVMAVTFPVAWQAAHAGSGPSGLPPWLLILVWCAAAVWAMFHFTMHGYAYPTTTREAFLVTALPLLNLYASGVASFATGALSVVLASMLAVTLTLAVTLVIVLTQSLRARLLPEAPAGAPRLLAALLPGLALMAWVFAGPLLRRWVGASGGPGMPARLAFLAQLLVELRLLYRGSVFAGPMDSSSERARLTAAWTPLVILSMMGSLLAFGIIALWYTP